MRLALVILYVLLSLTATSQFIERTDDGYEMMRVFFGGGSDYLDQTQRQALQTWLKDKEDLHTYEILLRSHTDSIGSRPYNLYLSHMRSESVIRALEGIDIARELIRVEDFGEDYPTFDNNTLHGRLSNRRVDVILVPPSS